MTREFKLSLLRLLKLLVLFLRIVNGISYDTKRSLIFPPGIGNKIQFLTGFGIPVSDLPDPYSITHGYVIKTNFAIFNNVSVLHDPYVEYQRRDIRNSRWHIYELLQHALESLGYGGEDCLLQLICGAASSYFANNSLISEIIHVLLTPSITKIEDSESNKTRKFYTAEFQGKSAVGSCQKLYPKCQLDLLNTLSKVKELKKSMNFM